MNYHDNIAFQSRNLTFVDDMTSVAAVLKSMTFIMSRSEKTSTVFSFINKPESSIAPVLSVSCD